ncbi:MAG: OmpH family outer membrane protein [Prevotella sp.]|nr:OmpH family outer membrane protein [Prevotella sp.]
MKRIAIILSFMCVFLSASAQENITMKFGFLSYEAALQSMGEYALVQKQMADLRTQYEAETKRVEDEFNAKYEDFLEGQREFPKTILQKRQTELQELMQKNIEFKQNSIQELAKAEQEAMAPLRIKLIETLGNIGRERGYAFIVDTDQKALPFINPAMGEDINQLVQNALK